MEKSNLQTQLRILLLKAEGLSDTISRESAVYRAELAERQRLGFTGDDAIRHYNEYMDRISNLRMFISDKYNQVWLNESEAIEKVFLIVDDQSKTKVYARIFGTKIKAEKVLKERDERTGERLYPNCHIIERTIEVLINKYYGNK